MREVLMLVIPVEHIEGKKRMAYLSPRKRLCKYLKGDAKQKKHRTSKSYMRQINPTDIHRVLHILQSKVYIYIEPICEIKKLLYIYIYLL